MDVRLPSGVFNNTYEKDIAIVRTKAHWAWLIAGIILSFVVPPFFLSSHWLSWTIETCVGIIAVLGLNFVTGLCGQISLGQGGFMAVGAYSTAIIVTLTGLSYWAILPISSLLAGIIALVFGLPALRVKGFYLALATLAAQSVIIWALTHRPLSKLSGGYGGMLMPPPELGSFVFNSNKSWFFVVVIFMWLMIYAAKNIARTRVGRAFMAIRDSDLAAEVLGINIFAYKMVAFFLSGVFAGIAGALFAPYSVAIAPENFHLEKSIWYLGMLIVGGSGSVVGAIVGTVFLRLVQEIMMILGPNFSVIPVVGPVLSNYVSGIAFGCIIVFFMIFVPRGINHRWEIFKASYRLHPFSY